MRQLLLFILLSYFIVPEINGQPLTGTFNIPGDFETIGLAIANLNAQGTGPGGVLFLVSAGHAETGSNLMFTTNSASESSPIAFRKSGIGDNPVITASPGISNTTDGIIKFAGTDYVTIDGIDLADPATNSTALTRMEWGYAILMESDTNASQHITIENCKITLHKNYFTAPYSSGIYSRNHTPVSTSLISPSTLSGIVSDCHVNNCLISDVIYGVNWSGPSQQVHYGTGNCFGCGGGNTILQFGGSSATSYGIFSQYQQDIQISNNQVTGGEGSTGVLYGINTSNGINSSAEITNNQVNLVTSATSATTYGIYNAMGGNGTNNLIKISGNGVSVNSAQATTGILYGIYHSAGAWSCYIDSNLVSNCAQGGGVSATATGTFAGIYSFGANSLPGSNWRIQGNTVQDNYRIQSQRGGGNSYGIYNSSSGLILQVSENLVTNNSWPSGGTALGIYIINSAAQQILVQGNSIEGLSKPGGITNALPRSGTLYGIYVSANASLSDGEISNNQVSNLANTWGGQVLGIRIEGGSGSALRVLSNEVHGLHADDNSIFGIYNSTGKTTEIAGNQLYQAYALTGDSAAFYGICTGSASIGSVSTVFNNSISECYVSSGDIFLSSGLYCFGTTPGTHHRYYNNTVYLDGQSVNGINTAALFADTGSGLDLRNNLLINNTSTGAMGKSVAYWRTGSDGSTHALTSNFNGLYAGVPGPGHLLFFGNSPTPVSAQDILQYKTIFPQEMQSFSDSVRFTNVNSSPYDLHFVDSIATACESGGSIITDPDISSDAGLIPRYPNQGYPVHPDTLNKPFAPDCGAWETGGIPLPVCSPSDPGQTLLSTDQLCLGDATTLSLQHSISGTGIIYQWQVSEDSVVYQDIAGAHGANLTFIPAIAGFYRCEVTCHLGAISAFSLPVRIAFANEITSVTDGKRCDPGQVALHAESRAGTIRWYSEAHGGTAIAEGNNFLTPALDSTTTYYIASETPVQGVTIGNGAYQSTGYESPFYHFYGGKKSQYLLLAAELNAAGLQPGDLSSLSIMVNSSGTYYSDFTLSMGLTTITNLGSPMQTGLFTVYNTVAITPAEGLNTWTFQTPFYWDGVSNLVVETCWSNTNTGGPSCTVAYDPTTFTAQSYYRADNQNSAVLCNVSTASAVMNSRPQFYFNYQPECISPRKAITAVIHPRPALTISPPAILCSGEIASLMVTSPVTDFEQYFWIPSTNLYTDPLCTVPYTSTLSATKVYFKKDKVWFEMYRCFGESLLTTCSDSAETSVHVWPSAVLTNSQPRICFSGQTALNLVPDSGFYQARFHWFESNDGIIFSEITGATGTNYTTPTLTSSSFFRIVIEKEDGTPCSQLDTFTEVLVPEVTSVVPGSRCGPGEVVLTATADSGNNLHWYDQPAGGQAIGAGGTFLTPYLTDSALFYVSSAQEFTTDTLTGCETDRFPVMAGVVPPAAISVSAMPDTICRGDSSLLVATSLNPSYHYLWQPGGLTGDSVWVSPLTPLKFYVSAYDSAAGCGVKDSITVMVRQRPDPISIVPQAPEITKGSVQTLITAGGMVYFPDTVQALITWMPMTGLYLDPAASISYTGEATDTVYTRTLETIIYHVTATPVQGGCPVQASVLVTVLPDPPIVTSTVSMVSCHGLCDGSVITQVSNGVAPFSYSWSNGNTLQDMSMVCAGDYSVTVTDAVGQAGYGLWSVTEPDTLTGVLVTQAVSCFGGQDGSVAVTGISGGTTPYNYLWSTGSTESSVQGLSQGSYSVTVTDSHGCVLLLHDTVFSPPVIAIQPMVVPVTCPDAHDGSISLVVTGGTPGYLYVWSTGSTSSSLSGLDPGQYSVTVTDAMNCTLSASYEVTLAATVCPNKTVNGILTGTACYDATQTITVAGSGTIFRVESTGQASFIAGQQIRFLEGTRVMSGGYLSGKILPTGPFCMVTAKSNVQESSEGEFPVVNSHGYLIYPNPTTGDFYITSRNGDPDPSVKIEIINGKGCRVHQEVISGNRHLVNFSGQAPGLYFIRLVTENGTEAFKLLVARH